MLETVCQSAHAAVRDAGLSLADIAAMGLANQGETVIAFDASSGRPVYPAISWQDRRTEELAHQRRAAGMEELVFATTGLRLDAYFSALKLAWILRHVPEARHLHRAGRLRYGTSDAWLIWQLTGGRHFVTDISTASRTLLLDLATRDWSSQLSDAFGISLAGLPEIVPYSASIGVTSRQAMGAEIPITGLCVDQQAALFGQRAFEPGQAKITYGTGCFLLANIGADAARRAPGLLTSVGWQIDGEATYVFDGGVYSAGSLVEWLRELGFAADVQEISQLASDLDHPSHVMLIPAFGGLAAPHWSGRARACWVGMDQGTDRRHLVRSALEAIAYRVREIFDVMAQAGVRLQHVNVDGGLAQCDLLMQIQADLLGVPLKRGDVTELTALGVGYLAGLGCGLWNSRRDLPRFEATATTFAPRTAWINDYAASFDKWKRVCAAVVAMGDAGMFDDAARTGEPHGL
jgi:glycerol kinase